MPRFVILEHRWNGIHLDFMLEDGESLKTWAIDSFEIIPGREFPARQLSPHRAIYLEYEGPISGGRGVVRRVDRGGYRKVEWSDARICVSLAGAQLVGEAELRMIGSPESSDEVLWLFRFGNLD